MSNVLYAVHEDRQGRLWISSENGLARLNPDTKAIVTFTTADGLPFNQFIEGAHFQTPEGELFFGGHEGVISFFPNDIQRNDIAPEVVIEDLRINGLSAKLAPEGPLDNGRS